MDNQSRGGGGAERRGQSTWEPGQEYLDGQREALIPEIMGLMEQVNDASIALPQRFELASRCYGETDGDFPLGSFGARCQMLTGRSSSLACRSI